MILSRNNIIFFFPFFSRILSLAYYTRTTNYYVYVTHVRMCTASAVLFFRYILFLRESIDNQLYYNMTLSYYFVYIPVHRQATRPVLPRVLILLCNTYYTITRMNRVFYYRVAHYSRPAASRSWWTSTQEIGCVRGANSGASAVYMRIIARATYIHGVCSRVLRYTVY